MNIKVIFCDLIKTERQYITDLKSVINVNDKIFIFSFEFLFILLFLDVFSSL